jgi:hypothetical protein
VQPKKTKKAKKDNTVGNEKDIYYKYEEEHFVQKSEVNFSYKIPFEKKFNEFNENTNEPQYFNMCFITTENFLNVVNFLNKS